MSLCPGGKLRAVGAHGLEGTYGYMFWCPGCKGPHHVATKVTGHPHPVWGFDGNEEAPTFTPSLLVYEGGYGAVPRRTLCHSFVRAGRIEFLGDCVHALAGQTVDLPLWPKDED